MFFNDRIVFVELHKTGGTHIGHWLKRLVGGVHEGKHNRVPLDLRNRFIIGSVRNPWDWYVSLWAYGCGDKGSVRAQTNRRVSPSYLWRQLGSEMGMRLPPVRCLAEQFAADLTKPVEKWRKLYADPTSTANFQEWLRLLFDAERRLDMGEGYGFSPVHRWGGLMTYRYMKLFSDLGARLYSDPRMGSPDEAMKLFEEARLVQYVILNEQLEEDLVAALEASGYSLSDAQREQVFAAKSSKTNTSHRLPASHYYDERSRDLVASREQLVIRAHGYAPP